MRVSAALRERGWRDGETVSLNTAGISDLDAWPARAAQGLRRLHLSNNQIVSLEGLAALRQLRHVSLSFNRIAALDELGHIPRAVEHLALEGNAVAQHPGLVYMLVGMLPNLRLLDAQHIGPREREDAAQAAVLEVALPRACRVCSRAWHRATHRIMLLAVQRDLRARGWWRIAVPGSIAARKARWRERPDPAVITRPAQVLALANEVLDAAGDDASDDGDLDADLRELGQYIETCYPKGRAWVKGDLWRKRAEGRAPVYPDSVFLNLVARYLCTLSAQAGRAEALLQDVVADFRSGVAPTLVGPLEDRDDAADLAHAAERQAVIAAFGQSVPRADVDRALDDCDRAKREAARRDATIAAQGSQIEKLMKDYDALLGDYQGALRARVERADERECRVSDLEARLARERERYLELSRQYDELERRAVQERKSLIGHVQKSHKLAVKIKDTAKQGKKPKK